MCVSWRSEASQPMRRSVAVHACGAMAWFMFVRLHAQQTHRFSLDMRHTPESSARRCDSTAGGARSTFEKRRFAGVVLLAGFRPCFTGVGSAARQPATYVRFRWHCCRPQCERVTSLCCCVQWGLLSICALLGPHSHVGIRSVVAVTAGG